MELSIGTKVTINHDMGEELAELFNCERDLTEETGVIVGLYEHDGFVQFKPDDGPARWISTGQIVKTEV